MSLPILSYKPTKINDDIKSTYNMNDLYEMIKEYVGADCWAMTVNDEILWNSYNENSMTFKDLILESSIRSIVIDNPHTLFCKIFHRRTPAKIVIYMFGSDSWGIIINYDGNKINDNGNFNVHVAYSSEK